MPLIALVQLYLLWRRVLAYLRYFQQEGYDAWRFLSWVNVRSFTDPAFWLAVGSAWLTRSAPELPPDPSHECRQSGL